MSHFSRLQVNSIKITGKLGRNPLILLAPSMPFGKSDILWGRPIMAMKIDLRFRKSDKFVW
jgi:hypothetical protein